AGRVDDTALRVPGRRVEDPRLQLGRCVGGRVPAQVGPGLQRAQAAARRVDEHAVVAAGDGRGVGDLDIDDVVGVQAFDGALQAVGAAGILLDGGDRGGS